MNLNIRYGQMTLALISQAVLHRVRQQLGDPQASWDADRFARNFMQRLEADVRVTTDNTILVTYYNAPKELETSYGGLASKLKQEGVPNSIPWLFGYRLDMRFK